ncbi:hypothetical protein C1H46_038851 [Malus baccata]|uniref:HMA domain-containing protein n=1 Tax=Malus baccata TaxID=106549 RepID=A0A540KN11_MALBA|nr:hypothetical protein C1H46_038851 [Malus baccata]
MASQQEPLKYQTWILRVPMHCEGCKRKVKKVLQRTDGVYTTAIDSQQNKVTVIGNVGIQTLVKKLARKAGKQAQEWPEKLTGKDNKAEKCKNKEKQKVPNQQSVEKVEVHKLTTAQNRATTTTETDPTKFPGETSQTKATGGGGSPAVEVQISESEKSVSSKKNKGKGPKDDESGSAGSGAPACIGSQPVDPVDLFRTRQMAYVYPLAPYHSYVPSSPYTCAPTGHQEDDWVKATQLESLQVFSDENPNACFIM